MSSQKLKTRTYQLCAHIRGLFHIVFLIEIPNFLFFSRVFQIFRGMNEQYSTIFLKNPVLLNDI